MLQRLKMQRQKRQQRLQMPRRLWLHSGVHDGMDSDGRSDVHGVHDDRSGVHGDEDNDDHDDRNGDLNQKKDFVVNVRLQLQFFSFFFFFASFQKLILSTIFNFKCGRLAYKKTFSTTVIRRGPPCSLSSLITPQLTLPTKK